MIQQGVFNLSWTSGHGAIGHDVYVGLTDPPVLLAFNQPDTMRAFNLGPADTMYYWRVDERNAAGVTPGKVWRFRLISNRTGDQTIQVLPAEFALGRIYPNPFNSRVTITFQLPHWSRVTAALYDVAGRKVADVASDNFTAGEHRIEWSSSGVGSGLYFLRLTAGDKTLGAKVVLLR